jgi:hypothetical protein
LTLAPHSKSYSSTTQSSLPCASQIPVIRYLLDTNVISELQSLGRMAL